MPDRREPKNHLPLAAVCISAMAFLLGPCMGAGVAVIGVYVSNQTKSAVTDTALTTLTNEMKKVGDQLEKLNEKMQTSDKGSARFDAELANQSKRIDEIKGVTERLEEHDKRQESILAGLTAGKK